MAVIMIRMECHTVVDGDLFSKFVLGFATAWLPLAQVLKVCGYGNRCVECFQGTCPKMRSLSGPDYSIAFELRTNTARLENHLESFMHTGFLRDSAKETMRRLTAIDFAVTSSVVEYNVICPDDGVWNNGFCTGNSAAERMRIFLGVGLGILGISMLVAIARCGRMVRKGWRRLQDQDAT